MDCTASRIPYRQTNAFSKLTLDYVDLAESLKPFFSHAPTRQGIQQAITERKRFPTDRKTLVTELKKQYKVVPVNDAVQKNIDGFG